MTMDNRQFFTQNLSHEIWDSTYKWETDKDVTDTWRRNAEFVAQAEATPELQKEWAEKFYDLLENFKFVGGGRITANAGTTLNTTLINCFVSSFRGEHQDSLEEIFNELKRQSKILKSEGGYGICVDVLRPRGGYVAGIGTDSPGAVAMLDLWDTSSSVITAGSGKKKSNNKGRTKIRKGAQMVTMSIWHPSIEEFITVKRTPGKLTKFNMSVLISDKFMDAVKNNLPWTLEFPETDFEKYDAEWDGNLELWKSKKYPVKVWKTFTNANELWDLIMNSTYNHAEPGVLFIDRINSLNNLYWLENITTTNPCLSGDTVIKTDKGDLTIKEIVDRLPKESIRVWSYCEDTKTNEFMLVTDGFLTKESAEVIEIETSTGERLVLTPDHKVYTKNRGWVEAQDLTDSDELVVD